MEKKMKEDKVCPICKGTGFVKGKICSCISGKPKMDLPEGLGDVFGDFFRKPKDKNKWIKQK
jgi:hypothetical protein